MNLVNKSISIARDKIDKESFNETIKLLRDVQWTADYSRQIDLLMDFCDTPRQRKTIVRMLSDLTWVTSRDVNIIGEKIAYHVINYWKLNRDNCKIIATADDKKSESDGSLSILQVRSQFVDYEWEGDNFINSIGKGVHEIEDGQTALLFDDFIGSGKKIIGKYFWFKEQVESLGKNVDIKILSFASMKNTIYYLNIELGIVVFSPIHLEKAISESNCIEPLPSEMYEDMVALEAKLEPNCRKMSVKTYSFGYEKTEAMYAVESHNISDNVFPVFWWFEQKVKRKRNTLFKRLN